MRGGVRAWRSARARRNDDGAAAVEFALVLIPLLTILFGIISYGYMLSFRQSISQAAAEGARAAAVAPATADRVAVAQSAIGDTLDLVCGSGHLTCTVTTPSGCDCVSVKVDYAYLDDTTKPTFPGFDIVMPETLTYTAFSEISS